MIFTELQTSTIASVVKDLAIRNPDKTGDLILDAIRNCIPTSSTFTTDRIGISRMVPDHNCDGCRAWLRNAEVASNKGKTYLESVEYADSWESVYSERGFDYDDFDARR